MERPVEYEKAVREKEAAKENIKLAINERPREILQAETDLEKVYKEAEILLKAAASNVVILNSRLEWHYINFKRNVSVLFVYNLYLFIFRAKNEAKALEFLYKKDL